MEWQKKEFKRDLAYKVSENFKKQVKKLERVDEENERLKSQLAIYKSIKEELEKFGVNTWNEKRIIPELRERLSSSLPNGFESDLGKIREMTDKLLKKIGVTV